MTEGSEEAFLGKAISARTIWSCDLLPYIFRPGLIGPHSVTGHANFQDWVCWLVRGLVRLAMMPTGQDCEEKIIHWVPVDQVAKAIILISCGIKRG